MGKYLVTPFFCCCLELLVTPIYKAKQYPCQQLTTAYNYGLVNKAPNPRLSFLECTWMHLNVYTEIKIIYLTVNIYLIICVPELYLCIVSSLQLSSISNSYFWAKILAKLPKHVWNFQSSCPCSQSSCYGWCVPSYPTFETSLSTNTVKFSTSTEGSNFYHAVTLK